MKKEIVVFVFFASMALACSHVSPDAHPDYYEYEENGYTIGLNIPENYYLGSLSERCATTHFFHQDPIIQSDVLFLSTENPIDYITMTILDQTPNIEYLGDILARNDWMDSVWMPWMFEVGQTFIAVPLIEKKKLCRKDSCYFVSEIGRFCSCDPFTGMPAITCGHSLDSVESTITYYQIKDNIEYKVVYHSVDHTDSFCYRQKMKTIESVRTK